jgi:hypothetical protein
MLRFEIMPCAKGEAQAAELTQPVRLTVTTSPKHGVDHTLDVSERLRALGHGVTDAALDARAPRRRPRARPGRAASHHVQQARRDLAVVAGVAIGLLGRGLMEAP